MVLGLGYRSGMDVGCNEEMLNPGLAVWRLAVQGVQKADEAFRSCERQRVETEVQ